MTEDDAPLAMVSTIAGLGGLVLSRDAETARDPPGLAPQRYERRGLLGEGGMGRVEHFWDRDLMRDLALKRIRPELRDDPARVRQFFWEARVLAYLEHPNIVAVHDLGVTADREPYFTMKRAIGTPLDRIIAGLRQGDPELARAWPLARRVRVMLGVCQAVAAAHARGVMHRDLKPANLLFGERGEGLVVDWGLALPVPGERGAWIRRVIPHELVSSSAGTPQYMSPEQARGLPLDERSDVYALGVVLYEVVALAPPYEASSLPEMIAKISSGQTRPLRRVAPRISHALVAVVDKAMALDPEQRYRDASELAADVERLVDGDTPEAEHASLFRRAVRFYVSRDPGLARLRVADVDVLVAAAVLFGAALALPLSRWIASAWIPMLAVSIVIAVVPLVRWWRASRDARRLRSTAPAIRKDN